MVRADAITVADGPVRFRVTDQLAFFEALEGLADRPARLTDRFVNLIRCEALFGMLSEKLEGELFKQR